VSDVTPQVDCDGCRNVPARCGRDTIRGTMPTFQQTKLATAVLWIWDQNWGLRNTNDWCCQPARSDCPSHVTNGLNAVSCETCSHGSSGKSLAFCIGTTYFYGHNSLLFQGGRDSSVSIVTTIQAGRSGFRFSETPKPSRAPTDRLSSSGAEINSKWGCTSTPSAHLHASTGIVTVKTTDSYNKRNILRKVDTNTARDSALPLVPDTMIRKVTKLGVGRCGQGYRTVVYLQVTLLSA
jgi:hypothetical protein